MLDSTGALDLPEIPKTMLVIGGGYIGLELGSVYAALGTKVSVVEMTPGLLPGADRDLVRILNQRAEKVFEKIYLSTKVTAMKADASSVTVNFEGEGAPKPKPPTTTCWSRSAVARTPASRGWSAPA